jgi:MFS family permease
MKDRRRVLAASCSLALVALGLMIWSLFDPRPIPVVVAMSVGQGIGTLSLISFLYVVVADWRLRTSAEPSLTSKS